MKYQVQIYKNQISNKRIKLLLAKSSLVEQGISKLKTGDECILADYCAVACTRDTDLGDLSTILRCIFTSTSSIHPALFNEYICLVANSSFFGASLLNCKLNGESMHETHIKHMCMKPINKK